jgi:hypothetical protein
VRNLTAMLVAALVAGVGATATAGSAGTRTVTLAYADGPVVAFAQDGGFISWATEHECLAAIRVRSLAAQRQRVVGKTGDPQQRCAYLRRMQLALGGDRAIWTHFETGNEAYTFADSATLGGGPAKEVAAASWDINGCGVGDHFGGLAASGSNAVYSIVSVRAGAGGCDETPGVSGGFVARLAGGRTRLIAGVPPAVLLAVSGGRMALVPAGVGGETPRASTGGPVEVRDVATGMLVSSFRPAGTVTAVALSGPIVAVLVSTRGARSIDRYAVADGRLLGATPVQAGTADSLSMDASRIVFRTGREIFTLGVTGGAVSTVYTARSTPVGLSINAGRIAWGETYASNGKPAGRIVAIDVRPATRTSTH